MSAFNPDMETANKALAKLPEHEEHQYKPIFRGKGEFIHLACKHCYREHGYYHDSGCPFHINTHIV